MNTEFSSEIDKLTAALVMFQSKVPPIKKNRQSMYGAYADLAGVLETIRPALVACELAVVQMPDGKAGLTTIVTHSSGQWIRSHYEMEPLPQVIDKTTKERAVTPQSLGSVITYQRRYALTAALGISTEEDTDAKTRMGKSADDKPKRKSAAELLAATQQQATAESAASQPTPAAVVDTQPTPGNGEMRVSIDAPCSPEQVAKIKSMVADWDEYQPGAAKKFAERMAATGRKLAQFSIAEAQQLEVAVGNKTLEAFFDRSLKN